MDKALFSRIVKELLLRDGEVELPGLGLLHTVICPASFSDRGFTLNPPYKKIVFSAGEAGNSGGFASEKHTEIARLYACANNIPLQRAVIAISETIENLKSSVTPSQDYELPQLGRFRRMMDGSLFFVQSQEVEVCPAFDHLMPVSLKSLDNISDIKPEKTVKVNVTESKVDDKKQLTKPEKVKKSHRGGIVIKWAFGVVAIIMVLCILSLAVIGRTKSEIVDPLLYSQEQLDVLYARF